MMKILLFPMLFLSLTSSAKVLKVIGANCSTKKVEIAGSGITFNENDSQYLVTSEHVAPQDSRLCFSGAASSVTASKLTLVSSDWETGLALFKVDKPIPGERTTLENFVAPQVRNGDVLQVSGFPVSEYSSVSDKGRVLSTMSNRTAFLNNGPNIEVTGLTTETGLSGGKLSDADAEEILGILSHKRLKFVPGKSADVVLAQSQVKEELVLSTIAIPGDRVREWAGKTIKDGAKPNYSRGSGNSVNGLGLELQEKLNDRRPQPSGAQDQAETLRKLRGGGDGVGIGGSTAESSVLIEVSLKSLSELQAANPNLPEVRWIKDIVASMVGKSAIVVQGVVIFDISGELRVEGISSTVDFLRKLRTGRAYPILQPQPSETKNQEDSELERVLKSQPENEEVADLMQKISAIKALKKDYSSFKLPNSYFKYLQEHPGMKALSNSRFDESVVLLTFINRLR